MPLSPKQLSLARMWRWGLKPKKSPNVLSTGSCGRYDIIFFKSLENIDNNSFNTENIEKELRGIAAKLQLNLKIIAEVLRIAIWGEPVSPPLFETIEIIGKKATLSRLKNYLKSIAWKSFLQVLSLRRFQQPS